MKKLLLLASVVAVGGFVTPAVAGDYGDKAHKGKMEKSKNYAKSKKSIVDIALSDEKFSTLVAALKAADLVEALQGDGPFTVFAPTNDAFAKLPEGTVENLLKPENKAKLQSILKYHVAPSKVKSKAIAGNKMTLGTLAGQSVSIDGTDGVKVDGANVVKADVKASNGVIHVIDTVIMPK